MASEREQMLAEARATFQRLAAKDSGVRKLSEATRENDADTYNADATLTAFEHGLDRSVARLGEVADRFKKK